MKKKRKKIEKKSFINSNLSVVWERGQEMKGEKNKERHKEREREWKSEIDRKRIVKRIERGGSRR